MRCRAVLLLAAFGTAVAFNRQASIQAHAASCRTNTLAPLGSTRRLPSPPDGSEVPPWHVRSRRGPSRRKRRVTLAMGTPRRRVNHKKGGGDSKSSTRLFHSLAPARGAAGFESWSRDVPDLVSAAAEEAATQKEEGIRRRRAAAAAALTAAVLIDGLATRRRLALRLAAPLFSVAFWSGLAPWASTAMKLSPMPTMLGVRRSGSTGELPLLPYSAMATLTFVLVVYGVLVRDLTITLTHGFGLLVSLFYCATFLANCDPSSTNLPGTPKLHKLVSLSIASLILLTALALGRAAAPIAGYTSMALSMVAYVGPLSAARRAIAARSAETIPLSYAITSILNSLSWGVYGYFGRNGDVAVWAPGLVGLVSAGTQIGLHLVYGNGEKRALAKARGA